MRQISSEKRQRIVHDFARWTTLSALRRSPLRRAERVYGLLAAHVDFAVLFDVDGAIDECEFDAWHEETVRAFQEAEPDLPVGWAAKIVNVYLKTRVYVAGEGREGLVAVIHPPIDRALQEGLKKRFVGRPWKIKAIKDFHSYQDDYRPFVQECRFLAEQDNCLPIELEVYWQANER